MREGFESRPRITCPPVASGRPAAVDRLRRAVPAFLLVFLLAIAAPLPSSAGEEPVDISYSDPLEPLNRLVFAVNEMLDTIVFRPAAVVYGKVMPAPAKRGVRNVIRHLSLPFTFINDVAQGEWERSGDTAQRFILNTMIGFVGLVDVAEDHGLPHRSTDFGSTLASWGVGEGPYLVLPLAGPSNVRDGAGLVVQSVADPVDIAFRRADLDHMPLIRAGVTTVDFRYRNLDTLDDFKTNALDYYAFIRTLYRQRRAFEVDGGQEMYLRGKQDNEDGEYAYPPPRPDFSRAEPSAETRPAK